MRFIVAGGNGHRETEQARDGVRGEIGFRCGERFEQSTRDDSRSLADGC